MLSMLVSNSELIASLVVVFVTGLPLLIPDHILDLTIT